MLNISKLSVSVGSKKILNDISFCLDQRNILAVIGPNGAGKSTLLKAMLSFYPLDGYIGFSGYDLCKLSPLKKAQLIAYLSQSSHVALNFCSEEVVKLGAYPYRKQFSNKKLNEKVQQVMKLTDVSNLKGRDYFSLSGGEKQRVQLARVLLQLNLLEDDQPKLLLLDEHVSHLDLLYQHQILSLINDLIKAHQLTVVMVLHDLNLVLKYASHTAVLKDGKLYAMGLTKEVITSRVISDIYQMQFICFPDYQQGIFLPVSSI